jgi:hypothetical protein
MRGIPGTITQYGIENVGKPAKPDQFIIKTTYTDELGPDIVNIITGQHSYPLTSVQADEWLDRLARIYPGLGVVKVQI